MFSSVASPRPAQPGDWNASEVEQIEFEEPDSALSFELCEQHDDVRKWRPWVPSFIFDYCSRQTLVQHFFKKLFVFSFLFKFATTLVIVLSWTYSTNFKYSKRSLGLRCSSSPIGATASGTTPYLQRCDDGKAANTATYWVSTPLWPSKTIANRSKNRVETFSRRAKWASYDKSSEWSHRCLDSWSVSKIKFHKQKIRTVAQEFHALAWRRSQASCAETPMDEELIKRLFRHVCKSCC